MLAAIDCRLPQEAVGVDQEEDCTDLAAQVPEDLGLVNHDINPRNKFAPAAQATGGPTWLQMHQAPIVDGAKACWVKRGNDYPMLSLGNERARKTGDTKTNNASEARANQSRSVILVLVALIGLGL